MKKPMIGRSRPCRILLAGVLILNFAVLPPAQTLAESPRLARYTGHQIYMGIFQGRGPVAVLLEPIYGYSRIEDKLPADVQESLFDLFDANIMTIDERYFGFLDEFGDAMQSADRLAIREALHQAGTMTLEVMLDDPRVMDSLASVPVLFEGTDNSPGAQDPSGNLPYKPRKNSEPTDVDLLLEDILNGGHSPRSFDQKTSVLALACAAWAVLYFQVAVVQDVAAALTVYLTLALWGPALEPALRTPPPKVYKLFPEQLNQGRIDNERFVDALAELLGS